MKSIVFTVIVAICFNFVHPVSIYHIYEDSSNTGYFSVGSEADITNRKPITPNRYFAFNNHNVQKVVSEHVKVLGSTSKKIAPVSNNKDNIAPRKRYTVQELVQKSKFNVKVKKEEQTNTYRNNNPVETLITDEAVKTNKHVENRRNFKNHELSENFGQILTNFPQSQPNVQINLSKKRSPYNYDTKITIGLKDRTLSNNNLKIERNAQLIFQRNDLTKKLPDALQLPVVNKKRDVDTDSIPTIPSMKENVEMKSHNVVKYSNNGKNGFNLNGFNFKIPTRNGSYGSNIVQKHMPQALFYTMGPDAIEQDTLSKRDNALDEPNHAYYNDKERNQLNSDYEFTQRVTRKILPRSNKRFKNYPAF